MATLRGTLTSRSYGTESPRGDADEDSDTDLEEDSEDEPDLRDGKTRP